MLITPHFSAEEFAQPARHGEPRIEYPREWIGDRLRPLCLTAETIREVVGPMLVLSGWRSDAYNRKIGGARASQHVPGRAGDFRTPGKSARYVHGVVLELYESGKLPHLGGLGLYPGFVHLDVRPGTRLARWTGSRAA